MQENLNEEQKKFYCAVVRAIEGELNEKGSCAFFLDGPAGTCKTFVLDAIRRKANAIENDSVIAIAWSGVAATSMKGGSTMHSSL